MAFAPDFAPSLGRLGTESAFQVLARAARMQAEGHDVVNLGIGQPDFRTPDHIVEAGREALADGAHGYTPANGLPELRDAVADDLARRHGLSGDTTIHPDNVVVVPGGKPTMFFACLMFGRPGVEIMYPDPGFPIYRSVIDYTGADAVPIVLKEENGFAFDADSVLARITDRTRLIIINSPANPTGGVTPKDQIDRLVAGLIDHPQVALLSDEIYSQMLYGGREHVSLLSYPEIRDRLILLDGWSKTYAMTGWRLGFAVWPDSMVDQVTRLCINDHSCVNAASQHAGIAALTGPQDDVRAMVAKFDERRRAIVGWLNDIPGLRCTDPGGAFYVFPNIEKTGLSSAEAQDLLLNEAHVACVGGTSFGQYGEGYLRFSYANSLENIERAMDRIAATLERHAR